MQKNVLIKKKLFFNRNSISLNQPESAPKICPECSKTFENKIKLLRHLNVCHAGIKIHKCGQCNKKFTKRNILNKHINFYHNDDVLKRYSNFKCDFCPKVFRQRHILNQHVRVHSGEKPFQCCQCEKKFSQKASLCRHAKTHENAKTRTFFKCQQCQKDYSSKQGLKTHVKSHCVSVVMNTHNSDPYCDKQGVT